jgi:hypothetical protein
MGRVFGEGDKNHARRRFARRAEEGRVSKNKGLAVDAGRRAEKNRREEKNSIPILALKIRRQFTQFRFADCRLRQGVDRN